MFYLAYGSNLNIQQMELRCPGAVAVTTARIPDYELLFKGSLTGAYLTIEQAQGKYVPVGVWRVSRANELALDRYEGYPNFYYKKSFKLKCDDGRTRNCFAYIMDERRNVGIPGDWYVRTCAQGYKDFGFGLEYLYEALERSRREVA